MNLSNDLISQFVKMTNDNTKKKNEKTSSYGTVVNYEGSMYVKLDGSDLLTPVVTSSTLHEDDRVIVDIGGHNAIVTGNITNPAISGVDATQIGDTLRIEFEEDLKNLELAFNEGYDQGLITMNADGIRVEHTTYEGHTRMSADGFFLNNGKTDVLKCTTSGLSYTGKITGSSIEGGSINIDDNFNVNSKGTLITQDKIYAHGGIYTYSDIRGLDDTNKSGGLTLVTGAGHLAIRTEDTNHSIYLQSASGEVKVTKPKDPNTFNNIRAYNLLANNAVYANGVNVSSDRDRKRDIELYNVDALAEICSTPVYSYHLDTDLDEELKRIGIIMQEAPLDAIDLSGKGVDLYQMVTMMWKAIQQLNEKLEK